MGSRLLIRYIELDYRSFLATNIAYSLTAYLPRLFPFLGLSLKAFSLQTLDLSFLL